MSFGMLDGPGYDHTAYDSLESLDEAGLQHEGETALALARRLGDRDLWHVHGPDLVAFDVVAGRAVYYPAGWALPICVAAAALFATAAAPGRAAAPAHAQGHRVVGARHRRRARGVAAADGDRLDDVQHRLRAARVDRHRGRAQRLVPPRPGAAGRRGRPGRLRPAAAAAAARGTWRSPASAGGSPAPWPSCSRCRPRATSWRGRSPAERPDSAPRCCSGAAARSPARSAPARRSPAWPAPCPGCSSSARRPTFC